MDLRIEKGNSLLRGSRSARFLFLRRLRAILILRDLDIRNIVLVLGLGRRISRVMVAIVSRLVAVVNGFLHVFSAFFEMLRNLIFLSRVNVVC